MTETRYLLHIHHLDRSGQPVLKKYPLSEDQRFYLAKHDLALGNDYLGNNIYALTARIKRKCEPPGSVEDAVKWLITGSQKYEDGFLLNPYLFLFLSDEEKEYWHQATYSDRDGWKPIIPEP